MKPVSVNIESRKQAFQYFFGKVVAPLGFKFTPDEELKNFILEQEVILEGKHGIPFCPCQPLHNDRTRDMKIVCPCIPFHREHFDELKRCWCGLFVHEEITDPSALPQLPPKEVHHA